jgi:hypothetical protein
MHRAVTLEERAEGVAFSHEKFILGGIGIVLLWYYGG